LGIVVVMLHDFLNIVIRDHHLARVA